MGFAYASSTAVVWFVVTQSTDGNPHGVGSMRLVGGMLAHEAVKAAGVTGLWLLAKV